MRALEELRLVNGNIAVSDLQFFADTLIRQMGLMIGTEEFLRGQFDLCAQIAHIEGENFDRSREKIFQALEQRAARGGPDNNDSIF